MAPTRYLGAEGKEDEGQSDWRAELHGLILSVVREEILPEFENSIRRLFREMIPDAQGLYQQSIPRLNNHMQENARSRYWLSFQNKFPTTLYTDNKISVTIAIIDSITKERVESGPLSSIKIDVLVLNGDFGFDTHEDWTEKDFHDHVVRERDAKGKLLTGSRSITLSAGIGVLGDITFRDNSSWVRTGKFRLGARISQHSCSNVRIREASSEAFIVKDNRGKAAEKHHPPSLDDEVWRLEKIRMGGRYHTKLTEHGVRTVQDFLKFSLSNQDKLQGIFKNATKTLEVVINHARECAVDHKHYKYEMNEHDPVIVFNAILEVVGAYIGDDVFHPAHCFTPAEKASIDKLRLRAYENKDDMVEVDGPLECILSDSLCRENAVPFPRSGSSAPLNPEFLNVHRDDQVDVQAVADNLGLMYHCVPPQTKLFSLSQEPVHLSYSTLMDSHGRSNKFEGVMENQMDLSSSSMAEFCQSNQHQQSHIPHAASFAGSTSSNWQMPRLPSMSEGEHDGLAEYLDPYLLEMISDMDHTFSSLHEFHPVLQSHSCPTEAHRICENLDGEVNSHEMLPKIIGKHDKSRIRRGRWAAIRAILKFKVSSRNRAKLSPMNCVKHKTQPYKAGSTIHPTGFRS